MGLSPLRRRVSSAAVTILLRPRGRDGVILEDDAAIVSEDDDRRPGARHGARAMLARLRAMDPFRADLLLAAAILVEELIELAVLPPSGAAYDGWAAALMVALAGTVAFRRRRPVAAGLVAMPLFIGFSALGKDYGDYLVTPFFVILFMLYSSGRNLEVRALYGVLAWAAVCALTSQAIDAYDDEPSSYVFTVGAVVFGPALLGRVLRNRAKLNRALREKLHRLEREREHRAAAAAGDERTRIAGELHDVVAHALSAMVVQASGARRLAERDPARAADAFLAAETSGRDALTEIRRLLGVLRREDEDIALAPQPSLRHVASLVRRMEASGLPIDLAVEGDAPELPIGVDLTAYRVVQEALGGALEPGHAGRARVLVRYAADHVEVEVADDGGVRARPLPGIRERVGLVGGVLRAGARRDGGHVVRARLPLGGTA
jgi:signal transduction histidine kinase